jgi:IS1 family transposase
MISLNAIWILGAVLSVSIGAHGLTPQTPPHQVFNLQNVVVSGWASDHISSTSFWAGWPPIATGEAKPRLSSFPRDEGIAIPHKPVHAEERFAIFKSLHVFRLKEQRFQRNLHCHRVSWSVNSAHRGTVGEVQRLTISWPLGKVGLFVEDLGFVWPTAYYRVDQLPFHYPQRAVTNDLKIKRRFVDPHLLQIGLVNAFGKEPRPLRVSGCSDGTPSLDSLPNDRGQGEYQCPRSNSFGPCYEFVPPLRLIVAALCLICAVAINGYGRGWARLLCIPLALGSGWMILCGHKYWCEGDHREYEYEPCFHGGNIVTQKLLTRDNYCNTVIDMANVLNTDKQIAVISALAEGSSIRSIERITGVHRDTIMRLGVKVGKGCAALMDAKMRDLPCHYLEFDEIWGFIGKKEKHCTVDDSPELGDVWTFCAVDAETKIVPTFRCGKRDRATANAFVQDVASRMKNRVQISTDGLRAYVEAIEKSFGADVDYAQIVKTYTHDVEMNPNHRYSAPEIVTTEKKIFSGSPDISRISTSYVERLNGTTRTHMRRLTRLTLAFSKKLENFEAAVGLHFAYYNFVKRHNTLRCTPAMAAGVERDFLSVGDLVEASA